MKLFVYQVCYTRYQVSIYLWWIGSLLKYCKVPKRYGRDYLKIFYFTLYTFNDDSNFCKNCSLGSKMSLLSKNYTINKVESFWKSNFWPKPNMQNSAYTKTIKLGTLVQLDCFIFLLKFIAMIWSYKKCQKIGFGRRLAWVRAKNMLAQTILDKIFGTKLNNSVKPDRRRKAWRLFLRVFWLLLAKS